MHVHINYCNIKASFPIISYYFFSPHSISIVFL